MVGTPVALAGKGVATGSAVAVDWTGDAVCVGVDDAGAGVDVAAAFCVGVATTVCVGVASECAVGVDATTGEATD